MIDYLKFFLKSTNQHGVHSPFVFNYLTQCLYAKPHLSKDKLENVVFKSIRYFNCTTALIDDKRLKNKLPALKYDQKPLDIIVTPSFSLNTLLDMKAEGKVHNTTVVLVQNLRKQESEWAKALAHREITVSIDSFSLGILFVRKEQVKEHFTIRL